MANKYFFNVPYSCITYGRMKGYIIADDIEDAVDKVNSRDFEDEEYDDTENGSNDYDCSEEDITVDEYDIYNDESNDDSEEEEYEGNNSEVPSYYLAEVLRI
jgi:hypothetical protein